MSELDTYLKRHFQTTEELAASCSISTDELTNLVNEKLVPAASYTITAGTTLHSQAFGEFQVEESISGQYFHAANAAWISRAIEAKAKLGAQHAHNDLKHRFMRNFAHALSELDKTVYRLPDSFTHEGKTIPMGLSDRTESAWTSFIKGVFSLCVADPSSEKSIAKKEILQEAIAKLSDNGTNADFPSIGRVRAHELIDEYANASMPFSPMEYPRSSRKRLVEDLRNMLGAR